MLVNWRNHTQLHWLVRCRVAAVQQAPGHQRYWLHIRMHTPNCHYPVYNKLIIHIQVLIHRTLVPTYFYQHQLDPHPMRYVLMVMLVVLVLSLENLPPFLHLLLFTFTTTTIISIINTLLLLCTLQSFYACDRHFFKLILWFLFGLVLDMFSFHQVLFLRGLSLIEPFKSYNEQSVRLFPRL